MVMKRKDREMLKQKDKEIIVEFHQAYQSSRFAMDKEDIVFDYPWFEGWSKEGVLDVTQYPRATDQDLAWLESQLPAKLPALYQAYLLGPRCVDMDFDRFKLFPNLPGEGLTQIYKQMTNDENMHLPLLKKGFIPIGKGADYNYDPLCLNIALRKDEGDFEVVTFDHEEILCENLFKPWKVSDSFRELILNLIESCKENGKNS